MPCSVTSVWQIFTIHSVIKGHQLLFGMGRQQVHFNGIMDFEWMKFTELKLNFRLVWW